MSVTNHGEAGATDKQKTREGCVECGIDLVKGQKREFIYILRAAITWRSWFLNLSRLSNPQESVSENTKNESCRANCRRGTTHTPRIADMVFRRAECW